MTDSCTAGVSLVCHCTQKNLSHHKIKFLHIAIVQQWDKPNFLLIECTKATYTFIVSCRFQHHYTPPLQEPLKHRIEPHGHRCCQQLVPDWHGMATESVLEPPAWAGSWGAAMVVAGPWESCMHSDPACSFRCVVWRWCLSDYLVEMGLDGLGQSLVPSLVRYVCLEFPRSVFS